VLQSEIEVQHKTLMAGISLTCLWLAVGLWNAGCAEESQEAADDRAALALLSDVTAAAYRDWAAMPGFEERTASNGPHGQHVEIFVNRTLVEAFGAGRPWPVGATAVKDGYAEGELISRSIARRDDEGWFFAQFDRGDRIIDAGRSGSCLACHTAEQGYLISPPDPVEAPEPEY